MDAETLAATLTDIWKELLKVPNVGLDDHFLDLGGDSMLALRLRARVQDRLGIEMSAEMLFNCATVRELVAALMPVLDRS